jgi:DNA polymerase III epsilon subunit family exonuclease
LYIEDATTGEVTVCGVITELSERETKNGKPFLIIHLDDTTGKTSGVYFSKKSTYHKIKELAVGDAIIVRGSIGEYNGRRSFTFDKINRCVFPSDFVKKEKYKKTAPREYKNIFPEEASTVKVKSVFDAEEILPTELTESEYVVFDLETTGLDLMSNGITEIGAVKIVNGKIKEQFTTLVKPDYRITEENFKITGISEEMVKDAPKIGAVIPDFMKFIEGAILVAHNADFDLKFIKRFAGAEEYEVKNKVLDTLELARANLPQLRRHDLGTIAEYFGIVFHHHRALSDAYCTAEAFIELMKIKDSANSKG